MIVALFDADGTLYQAQFGRGLMKYARRHGRSLRVALYFASLIPSSLPSALGLTHSEAFDRAKIARLAWLLRGWNEQQARRAFEWITDEWLIPTRREHVVARLKLHQQKGHTAIIASGTFTPSLQIIGERLGVRDLVGTGIEVRNGIYTGRIIPPVLKGADKLARIRAHIEALGQPVDWSSSYAYGDSYSDHEFMELTGHPVAVHPEDALRSLALERKWELLEAPARS